MRFLFFIILYVFPIICLDFSGKVIRVLDGDTIEVLNAQNESIRIRLAGIDCPEKSQAFGKKAKEFTAKLCFQKQVVIIDKGKDRYGRTIGFVILPDRKVLNQELVRVGLAWHYKRYSNDENLAFLETEARMKKLGLWKDSLPLPPWEFRRNH